MSATKESKIVNEVRGIRARLQKDARKVGREKYRAALNSRAGFFLGTSPAPRKRQTFSYVQNGSELAAVREASPKFKTH
jgi:hypothetical protein